MSGDGYPAGVDALGICDLVLKVAHRNEVTLPCIELLWLDDDNGDPEPALDFQWYPTLEPTEEDIGALVTDVTASFSHKGEPMEESETSFTYVTDMHGIRVSFTILK